MKNTWIKVALAAISLTTANVSHAALSKFEFTLGGFSNGGSISGTFFGEDLNNDGYLSSFLFSQSQDFVGSQFSAGLNEVTFASATFNGSFNAGLANVFGLPDPVTSFAISNELTDTSDELFPGSGVPLDLFVVLNYNLKGGRALGDELFEGLLLGEANQPFVLGLGQFLPAPMFTTTFGTPGELPGGTSLTSKLVLDNSGGMPCMNGGACGVVHSVLVDQAGIPFVGGFDATNQFASVTRVPEPSTALLFGTSLLGFVAMRSRRRVKH